MKNSHFTHRRFNSSGSCYRCISCKKLTRETGLEESNLGLCRACLIESYTENYHSDLGHDGLASECVVCKEYMSSYS